MILYENGFIRLDYNTSTDILYAQCPNLQDFDLMQIHETITIIVEIISNYNIKKFVIDSSRAVIDVRHENYKLILDNFTRDLMTTRLQKLARIVNRDVAKEKWVQVYTKQVGEEIKPAFAFKNFASEAKALEWLVAKEDLNSL